MPPAHSASLPVNITIHGLDAELAAAFRDFADKTKTSLNVAAKELLRHALGLSTADEAARMAEWNRVCGSLPDDAADELRASIAEQRKIDWEMLPFQMSQIRFFLDWAKKEGKLPAP